MLRTYKFNSASLFLAVLLLGSTIPRLSLNPASAQPARLPSSSFPRSNSIVIPAGISIPVSYDKASKILVAEDETLPLTLQVAANIRNRNGDLLIPAGSEITGQLEPTGQGTRFVAQELILTDGQRFPLNATSDVVTRRETLKEGANTTDILTGAVAGAGAAAIIAGTTGDRQIDVLEVLGGAAFGSLMGWVLPEAGVIGGGTKEVISINPNQDLTLSLQSPLTFNNNNLPRSGVFSSQSRFR